MIREYRITTTAAFQFNGIVPAAPNERHFRLWRHGFPL
jgi:hypothetical protein